MEQSSGLQGDDQLAFDAATTLKKQGIAEFTSKVPNKEAAMKFMKEALDEIRKVQVRNQEVASLESNICQNMALIHK